MTKLQIRRFWVDMMAETQPLTSRRVIIIALGTLTIVVCIATFVGSTQTETHGNDGAISLSTQDTNLAWSRKKRQERHAQMKHACHGIRASGRRLLKASEGPEVHTICAVYARRNNGIGRSGTPMEDQSRSMSAAMRQGLPLYHRKPQLLLQTANRCASGTTEPETPLLYPFLKRMEFAGGATFPYW